MAKDPAQRPPNAEALLRSLDDPALVSGAVPSLAAIPSLKRAGPRPRWLIPAVVGGLLIAAAAGWALTRSGRMGNASPPTIAVLPLQLASSDTADAYLAQGVTDEVLNALSRVPGIRLASRLSARSLAGAAQPAEIARQLGVTMTLEGSVQRRGDRVRITTQLANVEDGVTVWSETYDRPNAELHALQGEIAASVSAVVRAGVAGDAAPGVTSTRDPAAYDDYLRGHYLLLRRGAAPLREAITRFESAITRDSMFASAWAEMAQAYAVLPLYTGGGPDILANAERAATRALALDSSLAPAHAAHGYLQTLQWSWEEGRRSLERAVALDSSDATALQWLGENHMLAGDAARARDAFAAAARADAESPIARALQGVAMSLGGDHDAGIGLLRRVIDRDPSQAVPRFMLGTVYCYAGRYRDAVSELREARRLAPNVLTVVGTLGHAMARDGDIAGARRLLAEVRRTPSQPGAQAAIAKIATGLGDIDLALSALQLAAAQHDSFFASEPLRSPLFASLTGHPGWPALRATLRLSDAR